MKQFNKLKIRFLKETKASVAVIFAFALVPIMISIGFAIDYSRAADAKAFIQSAADTTILNILLDTSTTNCELKIQKARESIISFMKQKPWIRYNEGGIVLTNDAKGECTLSFPAEMDNSVMAFFGYKVMNLTANASAMGGKGQKLEVAIALDNTGSMHSDMPALKTAAKNFVNSLYDKAADPAFVKVGLVPYVAAVNPGKKYIDNAAMADYDGLSWTHGYLFNRQEGRAVVGKNYYATGNGECGKPPAGPYVLPDPNAPPYVDHGSGSGGGSDRQTWLKDIFGSAGSRFASVATELLGVNSAHAGGNGGTPIWANPSKWNQDFSFQDKSGSGIPVPITFPYPYINDTNGYAIDLETCWLINPRHVNHFDLFNNIQGATWKGCVEARPDPYDMTDDAPTSNPDTKFVPYFAPSDPEMNGGPAVRNWNNYNPNVFNNSYMPNFIGSNVWIEQAGFIYPETQGATDLFKYNLSSPPLVPFAETGPVTIGPNKSCPNEVTPLTSSKDELNYQIDKLTHWYGGGTITSEGLMWAWRVLSPNLPYGGTSVGGAAYSDTTVKKYIVLMTDGINDIENDGPRTTTIDKGVTYSVATTGIKSDYTAYGALWNYAAAPGVPRPSAVGYMGGTNFPEIRTILNERFATACTNAKAKGITVYVIYFNHQVDSPTDQVTTANYLKACSGADKFFNVADGFHLDDAFFAIASSIKSGVYLSK